MYGFIENYGLTIIVFTLFVRLCLFPLYASQTKHQVTMQSVQPKIQALQKKYANDKEELNKQMMELYKEENFNPMLGCLPMVIQMPIIMALYSLLRDPNAYLTGKHLDMIMAVHEKFLWIPDLSQPDLWILPILSGITTFISFSLTQAQTNQDPTNNQMAPMMKTMKFVFPIMIVYMGRSFPAGLTLYWFIGNIATVIQFNVLQLMKKNYTKKGVPAKKKKPVKSMSEADAPKL
jgi:YidC/Oxa1 family membrane protein insertase